MTELCTGSEGFRLGSIREELATRVQQVESLRVTDRAINWTVSPPLPGSQWNRPVLLEGNRTIELAPPAGVLFKGWIVETVEFGVFENPNCGEYLPFRLPALVYEVLVGDAEAKYFPDELRDTERDVTWEESIEEWTEYLGDSLDVDAAGFVIEWCSDGTGAILLDPDAPHYQGAEFNWWILSHRGFPTTIPRLKTQFYSGPSTGGGFRNGSVNIPEGTTFVSGPTESETLRFHHPDCGNSRDELQTQ